MKADTKSLKRGKENLKSAINRHSDNKLNFDGHQEDQSTSENNLCKHRELNISNTE